MTDLRQAVCETCRVDSPLATDKQIQSYMLEIPEWKIIDVDDVNHLSRTFNFTNFVDALNFTNLIGKLAEEANHHPAILTEWGNVKVSWWTHKIRGLHMNDFIMAAKTDRVYKN